MHVYSWPIKGSVVLNTTHKNGIIYLVFSQSNNLLLSFGTNNGYSIQLTNWQSK